MRKRSLLIGILFLIFVTSIVQPEIRKVKATSTSIIVIALYGDAALGWGLSPSNITLPGPLITAIEGDVVSLSLYSADGIPHRFYIDYNDNGILDDTEPSSQDFTSSVTPVLFEFTVTMTGNFTYRCFYYPTKMYGPFSIDVIPEFSPAVLLSVFAGTTLIAVSLSRRRIPSRAST